MPLRAASPLTACVLALALAAAARAGTFTVSDIADSGPGSLRQAVLDANASSDASNTIVFSLPASSTIELASQLPAISSQTLILDASGAPGLVIDGGATAGTPVTQPFWDTTGSFDLLTLGGVSYTDGEISMFGNLTLDGADDATIDGDLIGPGVRFVKTGSGTATISSNATVDLVVPLIASRTARIEQGTLAVDGTLEAIALIVAPQGTLAGNSGAGASVISDVAVLGRVAPSTATGNLRIEGPVQFQSGSVYEVDFAPGNAGDTLTVVGNVTVDPGAQLHLKVTDPTAFGAASSVTVLTASTLSGQFTPTQDFAFLDETYDYQPGSLTVTLEPSGGSLGDFAATPNQAAVASTLAALQPGASGDLQTLFDEVQLAQTGELGPLLDAVGGESLTAFATGRQILAERTARALHRRARDASRGEGIPVYTASLELPLPPLAGGGLAPAGYRAAAPAPVSAPHDHDLAADADAPLLRAGAWLDGFGLYGTLDGEPGEAEVETILAGGTLGVDAWIADQWILGLAAGYARSEIDLDDRRIDASGDTIQGALYTGWSDPRGYVSGYGRYAYTFQDSTRRIQVGSLQRHARADWSAQDYGAGAETGITLLTLWGVSLQPQAGVDWLHLTEESYRERSAGSLALDVDPDDLESLSARFGGRFFGRLHMDDLGDLLPELRAYWQREFRDRDRVLRANLSGAPVGGASGIRGAALPRDVVIVGAGWATRLGDVLEVGLDYDALVDRDRVEHQGTISARMRF